MFFELEQFRKAYAIWRLRLKFNATVNNKCVTQPPISPAKDNKKEQYSFSLMFPEILVKEEYISQYCSDFFMLKIKLKVMFFNL